MNKIKYKQYQKKYKQTLKYKLQQKKYRQTSRYKLLQKKYYHTEKYKQYKHKYYRSKTYKLYEQSLKRKKYKKIYNNTELYKSTQKKYQKSERGKQLHKIAAKRYWQSPKGKQTIRQYIKSPIGKYIAMQQQLKRKDYLNNCIHGFTKEEWAHKLISTKGICSCPIHRGNRYVGIKKLTLDHIFALYWANEYFKQTGVKFIYTIDDVKPICRTCNCSKQDKLIDRIYLNKLKQKNREVALFQNISL